MTPEAQRIAIAEACLGYDDFDWLLVSIDLPRILHGATRTESKWHELPDYLNDLNAMREAEKMLTQPQQLIYWRELDSICKHPRYLFVLTNATAAQRAEAFLRTIGKWEDSK